MTSLWSGLARCGALLGLMALALSQTAIAEDDPACQDITDREGLQRALRLTCDTIILGGELPVMTRAVDIDRTVRIEAGPWSIPPLNIASEGAAVQVTIADGRAAAHRALIREGEFFPVIIDVNAGQNLTLTDTTIEAGTWTESPGLHAIVRQDSASGGGRIALRGLQTETELDHILLLQHSAMDAGPDCAHDANAIIGASTAAPTALTLADQGVVVGSMCTIAGTFRETIGDPFEVATDSELVLERVQLDGSASGLSLTVDPFEARFSPIHTPAAVTVRESLWVNVFVSQHPLVSSESGVSLSAWLAASVELSGVDLIQGTQLEVDKSIACGISGTGALATLDGEGASAAYQRSALYGLQAPLVQTSTDATMTLENTTITGSSQLVTGAVTPTIHNTYIEGSWSVSGLEADQIQALRLVGMSCPDSVPDCTELPTSSIQAGTSPCPAVLSSYFQQESELSEWPDAMWELDRLVEPDPASDALAGVVTDATESWECGADPLPRVGAWPSAQCGLPMLAPDPTLSESTDADTGDGRGGEGTIDSGAEPPATDPRNVYGCQGRSAGAAALVVFLVPALLGRSRRRRPSSHPTER